jgi:release factor glutamine methyltransferase
MSETVARLIAEGIARLKAAGVSEPDLSARLLLGHILNKNPSELQLASKDFIDDSTCARFNDLIEKRLQHVPVQYLIGEVEFYNLRLKIDKRALIPRPETEELIEQLLPEIKSRKRVSVLDIGAGSGNIAIALAANVNNIEITSVDIAAEALELAKDNAELNGVSSKIKFVLGNALQENFWSEIGHYDVIVSNPPYVDTSDFENLQPDVKLHEPQRALVAENSALIFFEMICKHARTVLNHPGIICFEIGFGQSDSVSDIIQRYLPQSSVAIKKDYAGIPRIVIAHLN